MAKQNSYTDDVREILPGGNAGWKPGSLSGDLHRDDRVAFHVLECTATITATAGGALSDAAIAQLLSGVTLDFHHNLGNGNTSQNPHNKVTFGDLKLLGYNQLERALSGLADATTGLKKVLEIGSNTVVFYMLQPLGKLEFVPELRTIGGMGADQLLDAKLYIKAEANPLPAGYTFGGLSVKLVPYTERGNGAHVGMVPEYARDLTVDGKVMELGPGLTFYVVDTAKTLALNTYPELEVRVGDAVVTPFQLPSRIFSDYTAEPNTGATEQLVSSDVTPLYLVPDTALTNVRTGRVRLEKKTDTVDFAIAYARFVINDDSDKLVMQQVRNIARKRDRGVECLAVNNAALAKMPLDKSQHLAVLGFTVFDSENDPRQMRLYPGLLCPGGVPNAVPAVHIPPAWLNSYAARWAAAWKANERDTASSLERELCAYIPGCQTSDRGLGDVENWVRVSVRQALARAGGVDLNA